MSSLIKEHAKFLHRLGMNVTCINNYKTSYNIGHKDILKAPSHNWEHLISQKQSTDEFNSYDWETAVGLGVVLGYNDIMAIDIDGCIDKDFVK